MTRRTDDIKVGDSFYAYVCKGKRSKRLDGREGAHERLGPFKCTKVRKDAVVCENYVFLYSRFTIRKAKPET